MGRRYIGSLGDTLPATTLPGATGWIALAMNSPTDPGPTVVWNAVGPTGCAVLTKDASGAIGRPIAGGAQGVGNINLPTLPITLYLIPTAMGADYAPIASVTVYAAAGLYVSPGALPAALILSSYHLPANLPVNPPPPAQSSSGGNPPPANSGSGSNPPPATTNTNPPIVLNTDRMAGATGWMLVVVASLPHFDLTWGESGAPIDKVIIQVGDGLLQLFTSGSNGGTASADWLGSFEVVHMYLVPVDTNGNQYAPAEVLTIKGAPGIYASASVPASYLTAAKQANPGLQVFQGASPADAAKVVTSTGFFDGFWTWIQANPIPAAIGGVGGLWGLSKLFGNRGR